MLSPHSPEKYRSNDDEMANDEMVISSSNSSSSSNSNSSSSSNSNISSSSNISSNIISSGSSNIISSGSSDMKQSGIRQFFSLKQIPNVTPPPAQAMTENVTGTVSTLKRPRNETSGSTVSQSINVNTDTDADADAEDTESSSNGSAGDYEPGPWTCQVCTLINDPCLEYECGACEAERPKKIREDLHNSQQAS